MQRAVSNLWKTLGTTRGEGRRGGGGRCWPYRRTGRAGVLLSRPFPSSPSLLDLKSEGSVFYAESGLTHTWSNRLQPAAWYLPDLLQTMSSGDASVSELCRSGVNLEKRSRYWCKVAHQLIICLKTRPAYLHTSRSFRLGARFKVKTRENWCWTKNS